MIDSATIELLFSQHVHRVIDEPSQLVLTIALGQRCNQAILDCLRRFRRANFDALLTNKGMIQSLTDQYRQVLGIKERQLPLDNGMRQSKLMQSTLASLKQLQTLDV